MIHPSYLELMQKMNENSDIGDEPVVNSRYSIVCATAKRARQLIDGDEPLIDIKPGEKRKPLSIAVEEMDNGLLKIQTPEEKQETEEKIKEAYAEPETEETEDILAEELSEDEPAPSDGESQE
ncbi:MAG: DNA-directed RNA polymerase subunit omega [Lachnospiraceae bacterium]|jgi:DNA-directed RNA polymerase subunit omega|nr:DNA-directed RNA polymerase subunit omega [Lachnospiraceae bacterium]